MVNVCVAGAGVDTVADPGAGAVLQRARVRAQPRHARRQQRLARVQLQHLPGVRALGHARPSAEPRTLLQGGYYFLYYTYIQIHIHTNTHTHAYILTYIQL